MKDKFFFIQILKKLITLLNYLALYITEQRLQMQ